MRRAFDFHTHILPGLDDGSRSVEESLAMIKELQLQGASGIAATPHFYGTQMSPEKFLEKRAEAFKLLEPYLEPDMPKLRLGAEVQYFEGMHRISDLEKFCIEGSQILLIEMPMHDWTSRMVDSVLDINDHEDIIVMLAHIERYLSKSNEKAFRAFREQGVLMQSNASFFIEHSWTALRMLKKGQIHFIGTDAHNMRSRKPNLSQALELIERKAKGQLEAMAEREVMLLNEAEKNMD